MPWCSTSERPLTLELRQHLCCEQQLLFAGPLAPVPMANQKPLPVGKARAMEEEKRGGKAGGVATRASKHTDIAYTRIRCRRYMLCCMRMMSILSL